VTSDQAIEEEIAKDLKTLQQTREEEVELAGGRLKGWSSIAFSPLASNYLHGTSLDPEPCSPFVTLIMYEVKNPSFVPEFHDLLVWFAASY
jgi:hypothetical protein